MENKEIVVVRKGPWTREEDIKLISYILRYGNRNWKSLPAKAGLQRCGKSCRQRWTNYLSPDIKRGNISFVEEKIIVQLHAVLGNRWSAIASRLPKRTDNEIKNYWKFHLQKKLTKMGTDRPATHKSANAIEKNLKHMAQWERVRLQTEARLGRRSFKHPTYSINYKYNSMISFKPPQSPLCYGVLNAVANWLHPAATIQYYDENQPAAMEGQVVEEYVVTDADVNNNDVTATKEFITFF